MPRIKIGVQLHPQATTVAALREAWKACDALGLVGGGGGKVTLRLVAQYADSWNAFGPPLQYKQKNAVLDEWCARVGRDPRQIERTVGIRVDEVHEWEAYVDSGAEHLIVMLG